MSDVLSGYLSQWREADPQRAAAWLFLRRDERVRYGALAALQDEWLQVVRDVREPQVAVTKLGWWRDEVEHAAHGEARHPLTQSLFADARVREVPMAYWTAAVDACLRARAASPPADFPAQLVAARGLAVPFAELETRVWFGAHADTARASAVTSIAQLLTNLRGLTVEIENGRPPLPMNLLARHGLTLDGLVTDSPARRDAVRDHAANLERELARTATIPGPLTLFCAVRLQHDLRALRQAARAEDSLVSLRAPEHGFRNLLKTWRAARIWRGIPVTEAHA